MKTRVILLAVACVLFTSLLGAAQSRKQSNRRWGITAGANLNEIHFKQSDLLKTGRLMGATVGVTGELMIPGIGFGVDGSLLYTLKRGQLHMGEHTVWSSQGLGDENCALHYIDVPINLKFKYHRLNGVENTIMPVVYVGPTFSFLAGHNTLGPDGGALNYTKVSVLLRAGVGCELFRKVQLNVGYCFSVGETLRTKLLDENSAKNRTWMASATYFF